MDDLERFIKAQERAYEIALNEIKEGKKRSHWIWYIFPQLKGLGHSYHSSYYGISDFEEAKAYINHPILGNRLREISNALLSLPESLTARDILGSIDSTKVWSSMTLFSIVSGESIFAEVLDRFYNGKLDKRTQSLLNLK